MEFVLGVDFGTTFTCVSYLDTIAKVIPNEFGEFTTPTCVMVEDQSILFGKVAAENKKSLGFLKRYISGDNDTKIHGFLLKDIIIQFLSYIKNFSELNTGKIFKEAVITVPTQFNNDQRNFLKMCFIECGLSVLRILNEPTAAIFSYQCTKTQTALVFDCGGGTTDLSLLEMDHSVFQVTNVVGDNNLGGIDLTNKLANCIIKKLGLQNISEKELFYFQSLAEEKKKELSYNENVSVFVESKNRQIIISRNEFIYECRDFFNKIRNLIRNICGDLRTSFGNIDKVIFVGGSTKCWYFKQIFLEFFDKDIINDKINPDECVSIGASIFGASLKNNYNYIDTLLIDILGLSLGVEVNDGIMSTVISKNTHLPAECTKVFTNEQDNIETIDINIFQGSNFLTKDNHYLGTLTLHNLDKKCLKGTMKIVVVFEINIDGCITVKSNDQELTLYKNYVEEEDSLDGDLKRLLI